VAAICNTPCFHSRVPTQVDTPADGFQKTIAFSGGVVFANLPQFETLASNPSAQRSSLSWRPVKRSHVVY
jgi:hypothetical protein